MRFLKICFFCLPMFTFAAYEFGVGGGWRRDRTSQKIYEPAFVEHGPAYQQSLLLSPIWEGRGFLSIFYKQWQLLGDVRYAPYSHQSGDIHDFDRTSGPVAQEASFTIRPSGYALGTLGELSYCWRLSQRFSLLAVGGYVYDQLHVIRKHAQPHPFVFPNAVVNFFSPVIKAEKDQVWGPFLGIDCKIEWPTCFVLQGGYEYQFLHYKSTYENRLHLFKTDVIDQIVHVLRKIRTSHAFANRGHLALMWKATSLLHVSLLGEATYRHTEKRANASHTTIVIDQSVGQTRIVARNPMTAIWFTWSADLILSLYF